MTSKTLPPRRRLVRMSFGELHDFAGCELIAPHAVLSEQRAHLLTGVQLGSSRAASFYCKACAM